jgi:hypothetical protein
VRSAGRVGRGEDLHASDPHACWLAAHSKMAAVLRLIMLQAIQANISTPTAARLSWGACAPPRSLSDAALPSDSYPANGRWVLNPCRTVPLGAVRTCLQIDPRKEDVPTVSRSLELALFVDARLDVSKV